MINRIIDNMINKNNQKPDVIREKLGIFSGTVGIILNLVLCLVKFSVGMITGSVSITADAVNNLSDAGSGIVTIAGAKLANKPVDEEHPFGHGRIEYICALIVSFFIFIMSFELTKSSVKKIAHPQDIEFNIWIIAVLGATILIKLFMARLNSILYRKTDNINLKAVRQDSLNDCLATGASIAALLIASLTPFKRADGITGLAVAAVILITGVNIVRDISGKLLGQPPSEKLVKRIESIMMSEEKIIGVHDLIVHDYGAGRIIASAHAEVPSTSDIVEIHDIIDRVERKISKELKIVICVHMDPVVVGDSEVEMYRILTREIINEINPQYSFHDFKVVNGPTHTNLIFDLTIPYDKSINSADVLSELRKKFHSADEKINPIVTVEHLYV